MVKEMWSGRDGPGLGRGVLVAAGQPGVDAGQQLGAELIGRGGPGDGHPGQVGELFVGQVVTVPGDLYWAVRRGPNSSGSSAPRAMDTPAW